MKPKFQPYDPDQPWIAVAQLEDGKTEVWSMANDEVGMIGVGLEDLQDHYSNQGLNPTIRAYESNKSWSKSWSGEQE